MLSNEEYQKQLESRVFAELKSVVSGFQKCDDLRGLVSLLGTAVRAYESSFSAMHTGAPVQGTEESAHGAATGVFSAYLKSVTFVTEEESLDEMEQAGFRIVNDTLGSRK